ncbi:MAG: hypothetical protein ACLQAH_15435 [Limisphaerales bacterium]
MDLSNEQTASGSVDPLAQMLVDTLRKSGCSAWLGFPPPEELERLRAEKAERDFQALKRREEAKDRRLAELKERTRRKLRGEIDDEW